MAVERNQICISPHFLSRHRSIRLTSAINQIFCADKVRILFKSRPLVSLQFWVYTVHRSHGKIYIRRLTKRLSESLREKDPA